MSDELNEPVAEALRGTSGPFEARWAAVARLKVAGETVAPQVAKLLKSGVRQGRMTVLLLLKTVALVWG